MPVPLQRDPDLTRALIVYWFGSRWPHATDVEVGPIHTPKAAGYSGEILLFDASWTSAGERHTEALAVRVAPTAHRVFPDDRWAEQVKLLSVLSDTDVPVPAFLGDEPTGEVLGAPFLVMRQVRGEVPADLPSYHQRGWVAELDEAARRELWFGGIEMLARIHRLDPEALELDFLSRPRYGETGLTQQLNDYAAHLPFFGAQDNSVARQALEWLREFRPPEPVAPRLLWGDARIGNIIWDGTRPAAVLDWEMASLGQPEADLAWYLHLDRHLSEGIGATRLDGLPDRAETVAFYEKLTGHTVTSLGYYEVFAGFRFCVVTARVSRLLEESGILPPGSDFPLHRNATALLTRVLEEQGAPRAG